MTFLLTTNKDITRLFAKEIIEQNLSVETLQSSTGSARLPVNYNLILNLKCTNSNGGVNDKIISDFSDSSARPSVILTTFYREAT